MLTDDRFAQAQSLVEADLINRPVGQVLAVLWERIQLNIKNLCAKFMQSTNKCVDFEWK